MRERDSEFPPSGSVQYRLARFGTINPDLDWIPQMTMYRVIIVTNL